MIILKKGFILKKVLMIIILALFISGCSHNRQAITVERVMIKTIDNVF